MAATTRRKKRVQAQNTAAPQTRGLTSRQRDINRATGVNNRYNYNSGTARGSAEVFARAFENSPMATAADRASIRRDMRNSKRRKSNGGSGG